MMQDTGRMQRSARYQLKKQTTKNPDLGLKFLECLYQNERIFLSVDMTGFNSSRSLRVTFGKNRHLKRLKSKIPSFFDQPQPSLV